MKKPRSFPLRALSTTKKAIIGGTLVTAMGASGVVGYHYFRNRAGAPGAIVDLNEQNGMVVTNLHGTPAFFSYFKSRQPEDLRISISITTSDSFPPSLQNPSTQPGNWREIYLRDNIDEEDFYGVDERAFPVIEEFAQEFEELTGIAIDIRYDDPTADIVVGEYDKDLGNIGLSFPPVVPSLGRISTNPNYILLNYNYINDKLEMGNTGAVKNLFAHEFGHAFGLLHPHDEYVHTAMTEPQQDAVTVMSYNPHTFATISTTDIGAGYGSLDIYVIRKALRENDIEVPVINETDNEYALQVLREELLNNVYFRSSGRLLTTAPPSLSLVDNGGVNTLIGTAGDDLLVTESGYCGLLDRANEVLELSRLKDGQPFCLVEGEYSIVRGGAGDDLILTANGTEQEISTGTGINEVAIIHEDVGDKRIITVADSADGEEAFVSETTLTLHQSILERGAPTVTEVNGAIVLTFHAASGRVIGSITLVDQATEQGGIEKIRVVDNAGETLSEADVTQLMSVQEWQDNVIQPFDDAVMHTLLHRGIVTDFNAVQQTLAGKAGAWSGHPTIVDAMEESIPDILEEPEANPHAEGDAVTTTPPQTAITQTFTASLPTGKTGAAATATAATAAGGLGYWALRASRKRRESNMEHDSQAAAPEQTSAQER